MPSQVTKPSDNSWTETELQRFISWVEKGQVGMISVSLTELDTTAVPDVAAGSLFECAGALYEVDSDETPTGWSGIADDTQVYIKFDVSAGEFAFTDTEPSFDEDLGGWYVGNDRYLARVYKDASGDARGKAVYPQWTGAYAYVPTGLSGRNIPFTNIETITSGSGNWTVPQNVYRIKAIVTGGGGGGSNDSSGGSGGSNTTFGSLTGNGGGGGLTSTGSDGGQGGGSSGGDLNIIGGQGSRGKFYDGSDTQMYSPGDGGASYWGGGTAGSDNTNRAVSGTTRTGTAMYGVGGGAIELGGSGGGAGGTAIAFIDVTPGESIAYEIGSGGAGAGDAGDGADGVIYLEY